MGKPRRSRRSEPALIEQNGILTIELPRTHPRYVQGICVVTEWEMSNDDQSVIVCRNSPEECTADELAEVARYVPGYMCKGGKRARPSIPLGCIVKGNVFRQLQHAT